MGPGKDSDRDGIELDGAKTKDPGIHIIVAILYGCLVYGDYCNRKQGKGSHY